MNSKPRSQRSPQNQRQRGGPAPSSRPADRRPLYDFYAAYPCETEDDVRRIVGNHPQPYQELAWPYAKVTLLAQALTSEVKEIARGGHPRFGGGYKSLVRFRKGVGNPYTEGVIKPGLQLLDQLGISPPRIDLATLIPYSAYIQFRFTLARPLYTRDDEHFYIHENPMMKDAVCKVPMVRASTWKGLLRSVMAVHMGVEETSPFAVRLFGIALGEEDEGEIGRRGRAIFYPTFFDRIDLEILNPHSRATRAGTVPIVMETVPAGASGVFTLLYFPFDLINEPSDRAEAEMREDLRALSEAIVLVMRVCGFSAKRTRGFGLARLEVTGVDERQGVIALRDGRRQTFSTLAALSDALDLLFGK